MFEKLEEFQQYYSFYHQVSQYNQQHDRILRLFQHFNCNFYFSLVMRIYNALEKNEKEGIITNLLENPELADELGQYVGNFPSVNENYARDEDFYMLINPLWQIIFFRTFTF